MWNILDMRPTYNWYFIQNWNISQIWLITLSRIKCITLNIELKQISYTYFWLPPKRPSWIWSYSAGGKRYNPNIFSVSVVETTKSIGSYCTKLTQSSNVYIWLCFYGHSWKLGYFYIRRCNSDLCSIFSIASESIRSCCT